MIFPQQKQESLFRPQVRQQESAFHPLPWEARGNSENVQKLLQEVSSPGNLPRGDQSLQI